MASLIHLWSEAEALLFFKGLELHKGLLTNDALQQLAVDLGPKKRPVDIRILYNTLTDYTNNALVCHSAKMKPDSISFLQAMRLCWEVSLRSAGSDLKSFQRMLIDAIDNQKLLQPTDIPRLRSPSTSRSPAATQSSVKQTSSPVGRSSISAFPPHILSASALQSSSTCPPRYSSPAAPASQAPSPSPSPSPSSSPTSSLSRKLDFAPPMITPITAATSDRVARKRSRPTTKHSKITLDLQPGEVSDHLHVQNQALSPRLQLTLNRRKKASFVVEHLINKWGFPQGRPRLVLCPFGSRPTDCDPWTIDSRELSLEQILARSLDEVVKISYYFLDELPTSQPEPLSAVQIFPKEDSQGLIFSDGENSVSGYRHFRCSTDFFCPSEASETRDILSAHLP